MTKKLNATTNAVVLIYELPSGRRMAFDLGGVVPGNNRQHLSSWRRRPNMDSNLCSDVLYAEHTCFACPYVIRASQRMEMTDIITITRCQFIYRSINLSIYLFIYLPIYLSIKIYLFFLSIDLGDSVSRSYNLVARFFRGMFCPNNYRGPQFGSCFFAVVVHNSVNFISSLNAKAAIRFGQSD